MTLDSAPFRAVALAAVDALAVWRLWPDLSRLRHALAAPQAWVDRVGADSAVSTLAAAALWLVGVWLAAGLAAALLGRLPGTVGVAGRRFARVALPRTLYRVAAGAAGLGVLLAPVAASAHVPGQGVPGQGLPGPSIPTPNWPTDGAATQHPSTPSVPTPSLPTPQLPTSARPTPQLPTSARPAPYPPEPAAPRPALVRTGAAEVLVRPGDSLWQIAAAQLPGHASQAHIASAWPRWWAANRAVIGADPNHITPRQVLHAPSETELP